MRRNFVLPIAVLLALSASFMIGSIASATGTSAPVTYFACLKNGDLSKVGTTASSCPAGSQRIFWDQTGPTGPTGSPGVKGDTGAQGVKGDTGAQGVQGVQGVKGDTGAQGTPGAKGDTGAAGTPGAKGETGATGDAGSPGTPGTPGTPGVSGWDIIVAQFELPPGTDDSFVAHCPAGKVPFGGGYQTDGALI